MVVVEKYYFHYFRQRLTCLYHFNNVLEDGGLGGLNLTLEIGLKIDFLPSFWSRWEVPHVVLIVEGKVERM